MSELLIKHGQSCTAAEQLIQKHSLFASSVHCSYYSCIQLTKYIIIHKAPGYDRVVFNTAVQNVGSHVYLTRIMKEILIDAGASIGEAQDFEDTLTGLKRLRVKADYDEYHINKTTSEDAFTRSEKVNTLLKTKFSV